MKGLKDLQDKRLIIINEATALFSDKGFHATSMQEVADRSHVSKGTIYTYFESKEDLLLSIFKFFHENIQNHLQHASTSQLSAKDKYIQQIRILLSESLKYKSFFKMQHREQLISSHKTIQAYLFHSRMELFQWYESILLNLYGSDLKLYLTDSAVLLDSLISGFLRVIMIREDLIKIEDTALYITKRLDNMIQALLEEQAPPLLPDTLIHHVRTAFTNGDLSKERDAHKVLEQMREVLETLHMDSENKKELLSSLLYFEEELKQGSTKKFLFKGLLSNFEGIKELDSYKKHMEFLLEL